MVAAMGLALPVHADVYKCLENGKTVYGDQPCKDGGGRIDVQPATGSVPPASSAVDSQPGEAATEAEKGPGNLESMRKFSQEAERERRIREMDNKISKAQSRLQQLEAEQASEMAALARRRKAVSNDLADQTEQISIAKKQEAAALKYESKMKNERAKLERLQKEREQLN
jgi:hypothetical protein